MRSRGKGGEACRELAHGPALGPMSVEGRGNREVPHALEGRGHVGGKPGFPHEREPEASVVIRRASAGS